jgi:8-oxo-dGTP pyrophosphatase MutT (NUDIX family)
VITLDAVRRALRAHRPQRERRAGAHPAAVALILVPGADGLEALFIRRAVRPGDPWSGQVALPGGRREPVDVDLEATAIRETKEELAVDLARAERLGVLDDTRPRTQRLPPVSVRPFIFALPNRPSLSPSAEVHSAFWAPLARLLLPGVRRDVTLPVPGGDRSFPCLCLRPGHHLGHDRGDSELLYDHNFCNFCSDIGSQNPYISLPLSRN